LFQKGKTPSVVLIFVHGGNWNSGNKETYNWICSRGRYRYTGLYFKPFADYDTMTKEIASVIQWTKENKRSTMATRTKYL
jgi:hypothetical protein